jgi:predicted O-methyltransferase YrrM
VNEAKPVITQIEEAIKDIPGWTPSDQLLSLFLLSLSSASLSGDVLELGSWCGRSAVVLGMAEKLSRGGKVHCVDLFPERNDWFQNSDGSHSLKVTIDGNDYYAFEDQTLWDEPFRRDIVPVYDRFSGTLEAFEFFIKKNKLQDYIVSHKATLELFLDRLVDKLSLRLAFIDGDHGFDAVTRDILLVEQYLMPGGWMCFDDAFSSYDGVNEAIEKSIIKSGKYDVYQQITRKCFVARKKY